ncbi:MAG: GGDEF domain-containing protein, partial [Gallionella sp.]|nr:GGDEF domain-containing protein [Gallionella sp.]
IDSVPDKVVGINPVKYYANPQDYADVIERLGKGEQVTNRLVELLIHNEHERTKWALASYLQLEYQNKPAVLGWFYDITDRKTMEEQVQYLAYHDPLTDLPNRMLFTDRLRQALASDKRDKASLALMFIDLDKFKPVNDELGHNVGDLLLKAVAQRMRDCLRESDTVGRIGGDEFVVLLPTIRTAQDALEVAEKIRASLNQPFELAGHSLNISSSTGIAIYPEHGRDEKLLMKNADIAMYHAKSAGRNNAQIYRPGMQTTSI